MADKKNLCAQIDIALHNRVTEEKDRLEMTTSQYIASLLTEYYKMKDENAGHLGWMWGDRIFEKCGIGRDEGGDGGKTPEIRGKRRLSARDGGANYQQS